MDSALELSPPPRHDWRPLCKKNRLGRTPDGCWATSGYSLTGSPAWLSCPLPSLPTNRAVYKCQDYTNNSRMKMQVLISLMNAASGILRFVCERATANQTT